MSLGTYSGSKTRPLGFLGKFDFVLAAATLGLILIGLMAIYSVSLVPGVPASFKKQLILVGIGLVPFAVFFSLPYNLWQRVSNSIYVINLLLLVLVLFKGVTRGHAKRWLDIGITEVQPSEFTKIACILTLSLFFYNRLDRIRDVRTFALSFLHILPSLVLLMKQPHMGATVAVIVTWLAMALVAKVPWKYVIITVVTAVTIFGVALNTNFLLRDYHRARIAAMFSGDEQGGGYQQLQASIAFGSGGITGTGFLKGKQKAAKVVPEQHSDFILTVIGEEGGMVGVFTVFLLYAIFFIRGWMICLKVNNPYGRMLGIGVLTMLAFHMMINVQMNLGIGPVVGLWLPFVSYGSSAMWFCLMCLGLLLQLNAQTEDELFGSDAHAFIDSADQQSLRR